MENPQPNGGSGSTPENLRIMYLNQNALNYNVETFFEALARVQLYIFQYKFRATNCYRPIKYD